MPVPARVSPTDRVRAKIDDLFASDRELPEILEEVARLGAQLLMQAALEAEVTEFLGRDRYQRAAATADAQPGARNGYRPATVKTTAGPVTLERPKLRGTTAAFASRLFGKHVTKTNALESLVIASFVRGLSVRDVEATLADALGDQAAISKSTVSQVCQAIKTEYDTWARRPLGDVVLDYLFLDASFFRMHPGSPAEPILAAWGITTAGKPVFVGLAPGVVESTDAWANFMTDLTDRGLACPLLVVSDGAAGLIAAIEQIFPTALRQRCLIHRLRNVLAKIPAGMQAEIRDGYWACFDTAEFTTAPGPRLVELIDARLGAFTARYAPTYPAAMKIMLTDREGLTAYLRFPPEHHHRIRHSNFIERTFGETRRRTKVIGRFPGETSCVSIAWAVLDRASCGWRIGEPARAVEWYRALLHDGCDGDIQTRAALVLALTFAGAVSEAMAAAEGLVAAAEATSNPYLISFCLLAEGFALSNGNPQRALNTVRRGLLIAEDSGNRFNAAHLALLGTSLEAAVGDLTIALDCAVAGIRHFHDSGSPMHAPLAMLAATFDRLRRFEPAAVVAGFALSPFTTVVSDLTTAIDHLREVLGVQTYEHLASKGQTMTTAKMVSYIRPNRPGPSRTE